MSHRISKSGAAAWHSGPDMQRRTTWLQWQLQLRLRRELSPAEVACPPPHPTMRHKSKRSSIRPAYDAEWHRSSVQNQRTYDLLTAETNISILLVFHALHIGRGTLFSYSCLSIFKYTTLTTRKKNGSLELLWFGSDFCFLLFLLSFQRAFLLGVLSGVSFLYWEWESKGFCMAGPFFFSRPQSTTAISTSNRLGLGGFYA